MRRGKNGCVLGQGEGMESIGMEKEGEEAQQHFCAAGSSSFMPLLHSSVLHQKNNCYNARTLIQKVQVFSSVRELLFHCHNKLYLQLPLPSLAPIFPYLPFAFGLYLFCCSCMHGGGGEDWAQNCVSWQTQISALLPRQVAARQKDFVESLPMPLQLLG